MSLNRDCLIRLNPSLATEKSSYEYIKLSPPKDKVQQCIASGKTKAECHNYMRLLIFDNNNKIFACGTYAAKPRCWRFLRTGPLSLSSGVAGVTRSPSFPDQNVTGVIINHPVNNGYLFTGLNIGSGTRSSAIYREAVNVSLDKSFLKTVKSELFLKDANFVSSYVGPDNFVYFFWREKAIESQNTVYSRVGRVCSYDAGAMFALKNEFTSFTKSRLSCTVPGAEAFAYNYLLFPSPESTFKYTKSPSDILYGIFNTPENGLVGSAVCAYSLSTIQSLFTNSKYLEEVQMENPSVVKARVWKSVPPPTNAQDPGRPKEPRLGFTQIVVDSVQAMIDGTIQYIPVMFLATGTVHGIVCGIDLHTYPWDCFRFEKSQCCQVLSCVELQDPYCGWSDNKCTTKQVAGVSSWVQDIVYGRFTSVCPEEPPHCSIKMLVNNPGGTTVLECSVQGIPVPSVTEWKIDGRQIKSGPHYDIQDMDYSQKLSIHSFGLKHLGDYQCTIQNNKGQSHSCKLSIQERKLEVELKLTEEVWKEELHDPDSSQYNMLSEKLKNAVSERVC
ncbi:hypothetical protein QZH41_010669 [Actinostola sp. cb2023]|nr:hypothetical protein QZH41_010669 [Actinostola sp. cb2023]